ncbi:MAG: dihydropteroate synthase [Gemmatimonadetes bacterium]|nr:dihydropteroate synthase [Gemmatimonadota bacterium]
MARVLAEPAWSVRGGRVSLERPVVLGILNLTPDSFSDGDLVKDAVRALQLGQSMRESGADLIDVGGESTRPGAEPVNADEEWARIGPSVAALSAAGIPVSVDTTKLSVAMQALDAGAVAINDVSGLRFDPGIAPLCAETGAGLIIMHMRGDPRTMQDDLGYRDLVPEITAWLEAQADLAVESGVDPAQIAVDPGIGFGKSVRGNLEILARSGEFSGPGYPVVVGPSRKSFIGALLDLPVDQRIEGTVAACVVALLSGARLFRVHDVLPVRRALDLAWEVLQAGGEPEDGRRWKTADAGDRVVRA